MILHIEYSIKHSRLGNSKVRETIPFFNIQIGILLDAFLQRIGEFVGEGYKFVLKESI